MPMRTSRCKRGAHVRSLRRKARSRTTGMRLQILRSTRSGTSSPRQMRLCLICVAVLNRCNYYYITKLRSNHRASSFNSDSHLHYTHGAGSTLRALAVPGCRVPSRYPTPRREACSRPGLTITRQLAIWAHWHRDLAPPLPVSGRFSFAPNRHMH